MTLPDGAGGRILAVALCVLVAATAYAGAGAPLLGAYRAREAYLQEMAERTARLQRGAAEIPALRDAVADLRSRTDLRELTLPGNTDPIAAANLQALIARLAGAAGSGIITTEILPAQVQAPFRRIAIRVALSGELPAIASLLRAIDEARPALFVDRFEFRAGAGGQASTEPRGTPLAVTLDIYGFRV
jgi:hypothetical protein